MASFFQRFTYNLLWLTIFTVPFQKSFIIQGIGSINKLFGISLTFIALFTLLLKGEIKKLPIFYILLSVFILLNFASFYWAEAPMDAIDKSVLFLQLGFIAWAIYEFAGDRDKLNGLIKAYVLGSSMISLQSIYQYMTVGSNPLMSASRFFIEGYNPNELGILWALGLAMAVYLIVNGSKVYLFYVPLGVFTILLTGSRTALILLVFVGVCTFWMLFKYRIKFRKTFTFTFIIAGLFVVSKLPPGQLDRLSTIKYELSSGTLNGRTGIWDAGMATFKQSPLLGVGSGSFLEASVQNSLIGLEASAHNSFLSVLVENGLIGFWLFAGMLVILFASAYRIDKKDPIRWLSLTIMTAWMILSFASHAEAQKYTWVVFGFIITAYYVNKKQSKNVFKVKEIKKRRFKRYRIVW